MLRNLHLGKQDGDFLRLQQLEPIEGERRMKIGTYLQKIEQKAVTCGPHDSAQDAAIKLKTNGIGAMPVLADDGKLVGMISERDLVAEFADRGAGLQDLEVKDILTKSVVFMSPEADLADAMQTMNKHGFRHIPILSDGEVMGVISIRDALVLAAPIDGDIAQHPVLAVGSR
ncbi:MAG: CBS domain-containing protein [Rhizobiales bacterium]|nr:CBS domain-containing protein [Hyphomicrobiales bacterium]